MSRNYNSGSPSKYQTLATDTNLLISEHKRQTAEAEFLPFAGKTNFRLNLSLVNQASWVKRALLKHKIHVYPLGIPLKRTSITVILTDTFSSHFSLLSQISAHCMHYTEFFHQRTSLFLLH